MSVDSVLCCCFLIHLLLNFIQLCVYVIMLCYKNLKLSKNSLKKSTLYTCKQPLMMAYERSESSRNKFGKFIQQFQPKTKTLTWKLERILIHFLAK